MVSNGKSFVKITNLDIYQKIGDLETKIEAVNTKVDKFNVQLKNNKFMIHWIWGAIGTIITTFIGFLLVLLR